MEEDMITPRFPLKMDEVSDYDDNADYRGVKRH